VPTMKILDYQLIEEKPEAEMSSGFFFYFQPCNNEESIFDSTL
jgi:hypothetical protein